jgi:hypothetical protein
MSRGEHLEIIFRDDQYRAHLSMGAPAYLGNCLRTAKR